MLTNFQILVIVSLAALFEICYANSQTNQEIDFIYSPFYQQKYDITHDQGASTKIKVAQKANLVFVSAGFQGIIVIDGITNDIIYKQESQEFLYTIEATSDGLYILCSFQNRFSVFQFFNRNSTMLLSQANSLTQTQIQDMVINSSESIVYAAGLDGSVVAYDITQKNNIQVVGSYSPISNIIHQISLAFDNKWILLGNDSLGLIVLAIQINIVNNSQTFVVAGSGIMKYQTWAAVITDDNSYLYGIDTIGGLYICDFNQILKASPQSYPIQITYTQYWPFTSISSTLYSIKLTKDNNYIFVGVRSQGVFIFNIKNRLSPIFYQEISVGDQAFSINLSSDETYLYYANSMSIYVFGKTIPNLNNDYPNLFNTQQVKMFNISPVIYKWRCLTRNIGDKMYFFGAFDIDGLFIMDSTDPYNLILQYTQVYEPLSLIDGIAISQDSQYLYIPIQENNTSFLVYSLNNITNLELVFYFNMTNPNHNEQQFFSKDYQYFVSSYDNGVLLFDASNPPTLNLLCYWKTLPYMTGENAGVMITNDNNYILSTVRGYGVYVLDATNKTNLELKYTLQTFGAEGIQPSHHNSSYAFLYDGFKGIAIIDLRELPNIKIISRIPLQGWSTFVVPMQNDSYLMVAQIEAGMISLLNIEDIHNPYVLSTYQFEKQTAVSVCLSPDEQMAFINNNYGTYVLPLISKVLVHTQRLLIQSAADGSQMLTILNNSDNLLVGQSVQFSFVILYPLEGMVILSVTYYMNQQFQALPIWMNYDNNSRNLKLQIDKSGLNQNNVTATSLNTILLQVAIPLNYTYFQYDLSDVQTTASQAVSIFNYLKQQQYIDGDGIITSNFDPNLPINFQLSGINSTQRLFDVVKLTLQRGTYINPVVFYIEPSLSLNISNSNQPISTFANSVKFSLQVNQTSGKFVMQDFAGVIASTSNSQSKLNFEGSLSNLNQVLSQKVIFSNLTEIEDITVTLILNDGINYEITQVSLITDCAFIKLKQQLTKNLQLSLQSQFDRSYSSGIINIQEQFQIDFSSTSFIVNDTKSIIYQAYILQNQNYEILTPDNWIQFQNTSGIFSFSGNPPVSALYNVYRLKVVASDGYTSDYDEFYIDASGLPFFYVLNVLIKVFGPIFAMLGVYKYKSFILNIIFKDKIMYSTEIAIRGQHFCKHITLLGDEMQKSNLLFYGFIEKKRKINSSIKADTSGNRKQKYSIKEYDFDVGNNQNPREEIEKEENAEKDKSDNNQANELFETKNEENIDLNNRGLLRRLKVLQWNSKKKDEVILRNTIDKINRLQKQKQMTLMEREYLKSDGSIMISRIFSHIVKNKIEFTLRGRRLSALNFITDFKNPDSRIYKGVKAAAARYFLKMDQRSLEVYKYLKYYAITQLNLTKNDWYKGLVDIIADDSIDCNGFPVAFPCVSLNEVQINKILIDLQIHNQIGQSFDSISSQHFNVHLIREVLFADALGLVEQSPSIFYPSVGESIHLFSYEIQSVEAFKQVKNAWCMKLRKFFNLEYSLYGMHKGMTLPNWLKLEHTNGVIILQGTPQIQHIEDLLIRIIDIDQFVIKQYHFRVIDEYSDEVIEDEFRLNDTIRELKIIQQTAIDNKKKVMNSDNLIEESLGLNRANSEVSSFIQKQETSNSQNEEQTLNDHRIFNESKQTFDNKTQSIFEKPKNPQQIMMQSQKMNSIHQKNEQSKSRFSMNRFLTSEEKNTLQECIKDLQSSHREQFSEENSKREGDTNRILIPLQEKTENSERFEISSNYQQANDQIIQFTLQDQDCDQKAANFELLNAIKEDENIKVEDYSNKQIPPNQQFFYNSANQNSYFNPNQQKDTF